jgi:hypothetical protein
MTQTRSPGAQPGVFMRTKLGTIQLRHMLAPDVVAIVVGPPEPPAIPAGLWPRVEFVVPLESAAELGKLLIEFGTGRR